MDKRRFNFITRTGHSVIYDDEKGFTIEGSDSEILDLYRKGKILYINSSIDYDGRGVVSFFTEEQGWVDIELCDKARLSEKVIFRSVLDEKKIAQWRIEDREKMQQCIKEQYKLMPLGDIIRNPEALLRSGLISEEVYGLEKLYAADGTITGDSDIGNSPEV